MNTKNKSKLNGKDLISIGIFTACIVFPVLILLDGSLTKIERSRIFVIYIVAFFVIFFWAAYEQAGASLTLFASEQTNRDIFGWEMPASKIPSSASSESCHTESGTPICEL